MKTCTKCKKEKRLVDFPLRKMGSRDGRNSWCKQCCRDTYHQRDKQRHNANVRRKSAERRKRVLGHYGNRCSCCGEETQEFLVIDHVYGDGNEHRKSIGRSSAHFYRWLEKNNYPDGFQVLCHNCNMAKSLYGVCPHVEGCSVRH